MSARGLTSTTLAMLCALLGTVLFWSVPAIAAVPAVEDESVLDAAAGSATLQAQVNPGGQDTRYRFEYDTSEYGSNAAHGESLPSGEADAGSGATGVVVSVHPQNLLTETVYHFRVVATSPEGTVYGGDRTFTTQGAGSFALPDGRAWEMVSPPNKHGARLEALTREGGVIQVSEDGSAITYVANSPILTNPAGNPSPLESQVISTRGSGSWSSRDIATPHDTAIYIPLVGNLAEYKFFSPDLSVGLVDPQGVATALSPDTSEKTIYLRESLRQEGEGHYLPLVTAANATPGAEFGYHLEFSAATPDLSHVIVRSEVALTSNAGPSGLYEWAAGHLVLVSVLPSGEATGGVVGDKGANVRNAISNDGARVVWESEDHLYMRDVTKGTTAQLDAIESGAEGGGGAARFQDANEDGTKIFFTDESRLTTDSTARQQEPDLYEYDAISGRLNDLTVDPNAAEGASVQGFVMGASRDGSYVYFAADGKLATGAAVGNCTESESSDENCNLYVAHYEGSEWRTTAIAPVSTKDRNDWGAAGLQQGNLAKLTSRVSPNGRYLAFMSDRSLTGYDSRDARSGVLDEEVFLYDAKTNRTICASCDPTGARPAGVLDAEEAGEGIGLLVDRPLVWEGRWLAASIPGWTATNLSSARYQSRYLSDSGRLFFNSADALLPKDVNGKEDVYEYEPEEVGNCRTAGEMQGLGETFDQATHGCIGLISSGASNAESAFLDTSAIGGEDAEGDKGGADVFFLTQSRLVGQDVDTASDVYDAHECTVGSPCLMGSAVSAPACLTTDSCRAAPSAQPTIFGAPSSETFAGAGNRPPPSGSVVKSRSLTRAQELARALKACRKKPKGRRGSCETRARKRYGIRSKASKAKTVTHAPVSSRKRGM